MDSLTKHVTETAHVRREWRRVRGCTQATPGKPVAAQQSQNDATRAALRTQVAPTQQRLTVSDSLSLFCLYSLLASRKSESADFGVLTGGDAYDIGAEVK